MPQLGTLRLREDRWVGAGGRGGAVAANNVYSLLPPPLRQESTALQLAFSSSPATPQAARRTFAAYADKAPDQAAAFLAKADPGVRDKLSKGMAASARTGEGCTGEGRDGM